MEDGTPQTKSKERSVAYPSVNLQKAVEWVEDISKKLGRGPYSREDAVVAMGYKGLSGASTRSVAALVHYGLLDRNGNAYSLSKLAEEIVHPTDETGSSKVTAILKAATNPRLFDSLVRKYQGQALPSLLANILRREGISNNYAEEVASIFKETLQFSGLLKNGVVGGSEHKVNDQGVGNPNVDVPQTPAVTKNKGYSFELSGEGWAISVKSSKRVKLATQQKLIEVGQELEEDAHEQT